MKISISVATLRDAGALTGLRTRVAQDMTLIHGEGHWSACPGKADVIRQLRASRVLVARRGDDIIGTVRLTQALPGAFDSQSFTPVDTALYVLGLAVSPDARRQGVGRELMDVAKATARGWPAGALWLDAYQHVAGAGAFYEKCGFRALGPSSRGEVPLTYYEWLVPA
jgi:GNAT superfamily N-acetyltransferase